MIITLTPEDIIRRCLWSEFKKFVLKGKNEKEIETIITKNQPFSLSENDAYVIGLLKIIETNDLVHMFKRHMNDVLTVKSTIQDTSAETDDKEKSVLINKASVVNECITYKERFPIAYKSDKEFNKQVEKAVKYVNKKYEEIDKLETIVLTKIINGQSKKVTYLFSNNVSKLFKN
jgi:prefoldin subunit 5